MSVSGRDGSSSQACGGGLVVSDGLNGLPQAPCVSAVREVIIDFLSSDCFAFLMPRDRLALVVLRAALSPDLNASSLVFSSPRTSAVIHGFWFARVVMVLVDCHIIHALFDVSSHSFSVLLQVCVVVVGGRLFNMFQSVH